MNDNGLPNDPLAAAQFNRPALIRTSIPLNANRVNGQFFSDISGDFLRVDSCDYLCRLSFNNGDFEQGVPVVPGLTVYGDFSGMTLWHDDLSAGTTPLRLTITLGRKARSEIDSYGAFSALPSPYLVATALPTTTVALVPVPSGARQCQFAITYLFGNATSPFSGAFDIRAESVSSGSLVIPAITRNGVVYGTTQVRLKNSYLNPQQVGAAQWGYSVDGVVAVPALTDRLRFAVVLSAAATSNDGSQFSVVFK